MNAQVKKGLRLFSDSAKNVGSYSLIPTELKAELALLLTSFDQTKVQETVNPRFPEKAYIIHSIFADVNRIYAHEGGRRALFIRLNVVARAVSYVLPWATDEGIAILEDLAECVDAIADKLAGED